MDESARVGMRRGQPEAEDNRIRRLLRIDRLPRIGQRTMPGLKFETLGNINNGHVEHRDVGERVSPLNAIPASNAPDTKFKTKFRHSFETNRVALDRTL